MFNMGFLAQRIISTITAAVVLVTSMSCMCLGVQFSSGEAGCLEQREAKADPCCERHDPHKDHHAKQESSPCKHDGSGDQDHDCNHCQATLVVDSSSARSLTHQLDFSSFSPAFTAISIDFFLPVQLTARHFPGNLPPPVGPPTLLSLGCALNI